MWSMNRAAPSDPVASRAFLQSLHASGAPERIHWITGSPALAARGQCADVVILAPRSSQCRDRRWLKAAVAESVATMASGAVLYVIAPRLWRLVIATSLRRHGLRIGAPLIHLRSGAARYYVPLTGNSLRFALRTWPQSHRWRHVAHILNTAPGISALLGLILPTIGFPAYRGDALPFAWLFSHLTGRSGRQALVATSWRGPEAPTLVFGFNGKTPEPALVAKRAPSARRAAAGHEAAMLVQLGPGAHRAGVRVPRLLDFTDWPEHASLLETTVPGRPVSRLLAERPGELVTIIDQLSAWLERWHRETVKHVELTPAYSEQIILAPVRSLINALHCGPEYLGWLSAESSRLVGSKVPLVSTHNDLTMTNVVRDRDGYSGVVDWERALPQGLPLADFWYSVCDAAAAAMGYQDRLSTFNECFSNQGFYRRLVASYESRLRAAVAGPDEWIDFCFHACWLQHAANEQAQSSFDDDRPFLAIANALAKSTLRRQPVMRT
jgi:aminoglycoside phosphotransferase